MMNKKHRKYAIWGSVVALLIVLRLLLPSIVLRYANKTLANLDGYYGHVNDIDISLYRGAYQLDSIYINKADSGSRKQTPFFSAGRVDLSVEWPALFQGAIVGEIDFLSPKLVFTKDKTEISQVAKDTNDFRKVLKSFMPLNVNRFEIHNGSIHYVDKTASPDVDISLKNIQAQALNLTNAADNNDRLPSSLTAKAAAYEGTLALNMKLNALADDPTFDLNADVKNANLVKLNSFFKAYGGFDVNRGTLGLYTEFAATKGKFKGYVKPIIKDLDVRGPEDKSDNFWQKAKESLIGVAGDILENPKKDQVATKVPIEGSFSNTDVDNMKAIWEVLKNAFIQALLPSVDNEISLESAAAVEAQPEEKKGFFRRIFSGDGDKKKEKKEKAEKSR